MVHGLFRIFVIYFFFLVAGGCAAIMSDGGETAPSVTAENEENEEGEEESSEINSVSSGTITITAPAQVDISNQLAECDPDGMVGAWAGCTLPPFTVTTATGETCTLTYTLSGCPDDCLTCDGKNHTISPKVADVTTCASAPIEITYTASCEEDPTLTLSLKRNINDMDNGGCIDYKESLAKKPLVYTNLGTVGITSGNMDVYQVSKLPSGIIKGDDMSVADSSDDTKDTLSTGTTDCAKVDDDPKKVFVKTTSGTFANQVTYNAGAGTFGIAVGDCDSDKDLDIFTTNQDGNVVSLLKNKGDGTFEGTVNYAAGNGPTGISAADFDGNGTIDLMTTNITDNTLSFMSGTGNCTLGAPVSYATNVGPGGIISGDFNGDGDLDVAVSNHGGGAGTTLSIFIGNGDGTFANKVDYTTGTGPGFVTAVDLDQDKKLDLVVSNYQGKWGTSISIFIGNGDGTFDPRVDYTTGTGPRSMSVADIDGDGDIDLATANSASGTESVFLNNGDGTFAAKTDYNLGTEIRYSIFADIDGDADADLIVSRSTGSQLYVLKNDGTGLFGTATSYGVGNNPLEMTAADFNSDGALDLAVVNNIGRTVSILINQ